MPKWTEITKLSDHHARSREAEFEAQMLALLAGQKPPTPASSPVTTSPTPTAPTQHAIQIAVTEDGQTTLYNLLSVPVPVRQRIMNTWRPVTAAAVPPIYNSAALHSATPPVKTPRQRTMRFAVFLNLMVPGLGQIYLGQRVAGTAYTLAFLACFVATLGVFLRGYFHYLQLSTGGDILEGGNLEEIAHAFPAGTLVALSLIGIVIYLASAIHLAMSRSRSAKFTPLPRSAPPVDS